MNTLSWFVYLMDVISNVGVFFAIVAGVFGIPVIVGAFLFVVSAGEITDDVPKFWRLMRLGIVSSLVAILISCAIPEKKTMYAIAASEFGERVVNSERVQGIVDPGLKFVETWLKDQLKDKEKK
jgi:hypothetical protein